LGQLHDCHAAAIATALKKQTLIGSYLNGDGMPAYTDSSAEWFDKGLVSRFGKHKADILKMKNTKTYQEIIFEMLGKKFSGEEYILNSNGIATSCNKSDGLLVGIEKNAGNKWPMKRWNKYDELAQLLISKGFNTTFFQQKKHIAQYIQDINDCDIIVCGDTLAMHIALALKKKVVAIFICTSPTEIYGYGRMTKVISPLLEQVYYKTNYVHEAVDSISVGQVYRTVEKISRIPNENTICHKCLPIAW
jgi:heptosyltransferase-2